MKFASVKTANEVIKDIKENERTNYFGQSYSTALPKYLSFSEMEDMFIRHGFGKNETNLILASLVKAGCKFTI